MQLPVLRITCLPDKESEIEHLSGRDLSALFVNVPDFDGYSFFVYDFHVAIEERIQILYPGFIETAGEFGGLEEFFGREYALVLHE